MIRLPQPSRLAFTLIELLIVLVILAILAALVLPRLTEASLEGRVVTAGQNARAVQTKLDEHHGLHGHWPDEPDPNWFAGGALPVNPFEPNYTGPLVVFETSGDETIVHPRFKFIQANGVYWYNPANGRFRALVQRQDTNSKTLDLYNRANGVQLVSFLQTTN